MAASKPLLLLDNASMLALLHQGCFRLQEGDLVRGSKSHP